MGFVMFGIRLGMFGKTQGRIPYTSWVKERWEDVLCDELRRFGDVEMFGGVWDMFVDVWEMLGYVWKRFGDVRLCLEEVWRCFGDAFWRGRLGHAPEPRREWGENGNLRRSLLSLPRASF